MAGCSSPEDLLMDSGAMCLHWDVWLAFNSPLGSWSASCKVRSYQKKRRDINITCLAFNAFQHKSSSDDIKKKNTCKVSQQAEKGI